MVYLYMEIIGNNYNYLKYLIRLILQYGNLGITSTKTIVLYGLQYPYNTTKAEKLFKRLSKIILQFFRQSLYKQRLWIYFFVYSDNYPSIFSASILDIAFKPQIHHSHKDTKTLSLHLYGLPTPQKIEHSLKLNESSTSEIAKYIHQITEHKKIKNIL